MAFAISRKTKILTVIVAILLFLGAGGLCGYLYWRSLPPQQFDYWPNTDSSGSIPEGVSLYVDEIDRNQDGSGYIKYTLGNYSWSDEYGEAEVAYYGPSDPWVEYQYYGKFGDTFYQVYPSLDSLTQLVAFSASALEPGEEIQLVEILPENTLPVSGVYRFCVERAGSVEFIVMDDGTIAIDNEVCIRVRRAYEQHTESAP